MSEFGTRYWGNFGLEWMATANEQSGMDVLLTVHLGGEPVDYAVLNSSSPKYSKDFPLGGPSDVSVTVTWAYSQQTGMVTLAYNGTWTYQQNQNNFSGTLATYTPSNLSSVKQPVAAAGAKHK